MLAQLLLAAATTAATPKPLRHLEYKFHFSAWSAGEIAGYDGTIYVDVLGTGPNDTLVISIRQAVPLYHSMEVPAAQIVTYPTGQVDVVPGAVPLRQPELDLARFLGRKFINGDYLDEKNHWHIDMTLPQNTTSATDFTIDKNNNGILDISEYQRVSSGMHVMTTTGRIAYDMNRTLPLSIHETSNSSGAGFTYDFALTADSLFPAKP